MAQIFGAARYRKGDSLKWHFTRIFNSKLARFDGKQNSCLARQQELLKLKTRPRLGPVSSTLSNSQR
jgi:hypothetical protein